jgi:predicted CoA-binding protein
MAHALPVTPVHPTLEAVEGVAAVRGLDGLRDPRHTSVSVVTPPAVSATVVDAAITLGVPALWFQPGSEPASAVLARAAAAGIHVLAHGPCILQTSEGEVPRAPPTPARL